MNGLEQQGREETAFLSLFLWAVDKLPLSWLGPQSFSCDVVGAANCQAPPPSLARIRPCWQMLNWREGSGSRLLNS